MAATPPHPSTVANPESSGGKGPDFERRVAAQLVCSALTGMSVEPLGCPISKIWFQAGHLHCSVEDIVCEAESSDQKRGSRCYWSVKSALRLIASDPEFREFCQRAWKDFSNPVVFDQGRDWIGLATSIVGTPQIVSLSRLTQLARSCANASDFIGRLSKGAYNEKLRDLPKVIASIAAGDREPLDGTQVFELLRRISVVAFDLDQDHSQDKARTTAMLGMASDSGAKPPSDIWNQVFEELSQGIWTAKHFGTDEFNEFALRTGLKRDLKSKAKRWLAELRRHCAIKRQGIHSRLKATGRTVVRRDLIDTLHEALVRSPIVLVEGSAGSGKSAVALQGADELVGSDNVFCFVAEEFLHPHLDTAMQAAGLREVSFGDMPALSSGQHRVVIVDAVERILQRTESREAFVELLRAAQADRSCRVLLTCRDSHALTLTVLLVNEAIAPETIRIPLLDEGELDQAIQGTGLEPLVRDKPEFRGPLTNLKWLDLSLIAMARSGSEQIEPTRDWSTMSSWRNHLWRSLVHTNSTEGRQREDCLLEMALKRLNSLDGWVEVAQENSVRAITLVDDGLVREAHGRFTLDHDLIEDWALLIHVERRAAAAGDSFEKLVESIGDSLPMRRVFRQWIGEQLDLNRPVAAKWLRHCLGSSSPVGGWRDESLLSVLGAREAPSILKNTRDLWLADECRLFDELVRCLRISGIASATVSTKARLVGSGWSAVLGFAADESGTLLKERPATVAKLLVDWCSGQSFSNPTPIGVEAAASLVTCFWGRMMSGGPSFDEIIGGRHHHMRGENDPFIQIVALCAGSLPRTFFEDLCKCPVDEDRSNWQQTGLINRIVDSLTASPLAWQFAKHFPDNAIELFEAEWGDAPVLKRRRPPNRFAPSCRLTSDSHDFNTPSALVGPFLSLLRHHREKGVNVIISLLNYVTREYQAQGGDGIDDIVRCEFQIEDAPVVIWGHNSWWRVYRGMCPWCHYLVASALMATEAWLLDDVSAEDTLEDTCLDLIKRCDNIAMVAVAASVATAFPRRFTQFPLLLLQQLQLINWDRPRFFEESTSSMLGNSDHDGLQETADERKNSDDLPHRRIQLEHYLVEAQFGPAQKEVWVAFDEINAALDAVNQEGLSGSDLDDYQVRRLLIHRMDTRNLSALPVKDTPGTYALVPTQLPGDLAEIVSDANESLQQQERRNGAWIWATKAFDHGYCPKDPDEWRPKLELAQSLSFDDSDMAIMYGALPAQIAAACAAFFWEAMSGDEQEWCCDTLAAYVEPDEQLSNFTAGSLPPMRGIDFGRTLRGLGCLCAKLPLDHPKRKRCFNALSIALTHPEHRSAEQAAEGLGSVATNEHNTTLQIGGAALILAHARTERETYSKYHRDGDHSSIGWQERQNATHAELMQRVRLIRCQFVNGQIPDEDRLPRLAVRGFTGHQRLSYALIVLAENPSPMASKVFKRAAVWLFVSWRLEKDQFRRMSRRQRGHRSERARNAVTVGKVAKAVAARCLSCLVEAGRTFHRLFWRLRILHLKSQAHRVLYQLSLALDRGGDKETFWRMWGKCREMCLLIGPRLDDAEFLVFVRTKKEDAFEAFSSLVSALFFNDMHFGMHQDWQPLDGHEQEVLQAFEQLGPFALRRFIRFVATIGGKLMPDAWKTMAEVFSRCRGQVTIETFIDESIWKHLIPLIQIEVTHRRLPPSAKLEWAFIHLLLDSLVSQGCAPAFHIREECARLRLTSI